MLLLKDIQDYKNSLIKKDNILNPQNIHSFL